MEIPYYSASSLCHRCLSPLSQSTFAEAMSSCVTKLYEPDDKDELCLYCSKCGVVYRKAAATIENKDIEIFQNTSRDDSLKKRIKSVKGYNRARGKRELWNMTNDMNEFFDG